MFAPLRPVEDLEQELADCESQIAQLRARQAVLLAELGRAQVTQSDGSRSLVEWTAAHLDVSLQTARDLVFAAGALPKYRGVGFDLAERLITFDRAVAEARLAESGAPWKVVAESRELDLAAVRRLRGRHRRMSRVDERQAFEQRFVSLQPSLDESWWRLSGQLPAWEGTVVQKAMSQAADELRDLPGGEESTMAQRQADALVQMAQDSLDGDLGEGVAAGAEVTVFVDATQATLTNSDGEPVVEVAYGPRVGPATLELLACNAAVRIVGLEEGRPVVTSDAAQTIPPAVRALVAWRDGGCTIDGCGSRYRLQPHHLTRRADGGDHHPDNLTTLCWYHHHVAIHGNGYQIDPHSPPQRRRLIRHPGRGPDPP